MKIRALIVDDEALARRRINRLLASHRDIEVVGECSGGRAAIEAIEEKHPSLLFLDVQMPDLDGFSVLKQLEEDDLPAVVFVTAYDHYALRAFEIAAVDYLLKPYTPQRFAQAVNRALKSIESTSRADNDDRLRRLLREVLHDAPADRTPERATEQLDRFMVKSQGRTRFVRADEIDWIESDGNYIRLHVGATGHLIRGTIGACDERLDPRRFVRVHRRYIVNIDRIKEVQPWFGGDYVIVLSSGQQVRLSRTYREKFQSRMLGG